jgi:Mrp family chromosome partitioning ATPase
LRKPSIHKIFNTDNSEGLTDILSGRIGLTDAIHSIETGLSFMPLGTGPAETINLINSSKIEEIIKAARNKFELIFISGPDLKSFNDSAILTAYADGIILLVNEGQIKKEVLEAAIEPLKQKKEYCLGVILNNRTFVIPKLIYERT